MDRKLPYSSMHSLHVCSQVALLAECFTADVTPKRPLARVDSRVFLQVTVTSEWPVANLAHVWLLAAVEKHVPRQICLEGEGLPTYGTTVWLFTAVDYFMTIKS